MNESWIQFADYSDRNKWKGEGNSMHVCESGRENREKMRQNRAEKREREREWERDSERENERARESERVKENFTH